MPRVVGLDIGSFAVRAAEMAVGSGQPVLNKFGQVTLPPGAVRDGEVIDPLAVGTAIRRLWTEAGFRSKSVVIGVANQRVIVRQAELPALTEEDMASALRFEAQELIPIPIDEAILDFRVLEQLTAADGEPRMRILLAAAQRDMVRSHLAAVEAGGLDAFLVDVVPFALVRALSGGPMADLAEAPGADAILCIGGGVTTVVVHEGGVPQFVRVLLVGGDDITESIASNLGVDVDAAEDFKRRADITSPDAAEAQAGAIVADRIGPLVEEIRGSLDYYLAQADALPLRRVAVTGGGSRLAGMIERLGQQLGAPVEPAQPLEGVKIGARLGLSEQQLRDAEPLMAVPIGLALAGAPVEKGTRRITLLPGELGVIREQRRQAVLVGGGLAGLAALLIMLWLARGAQVNSAENRAESSERRAQQLEREVAAMQDVTRLDAELRQRQRTVIDVLETDVAWTRLLQEVATVIPSDVWLTTFAGVGGEEPTVTFGAMGFEQTAAARWLMRLGELPSLEGLWVPASTKGAARTGRALVTFSSTANITPAARSDRAARFGADDR